MAQEPRVGERAPEFTLFLVNGQQVSLSELRGQVVVINFWATWCAPCRKELPMLNAYYGIKRHLGLRVFAATTESSLPVWRLRTFFERMIIEPVRRIRGPYAPLHAIPTNFVIDRRGVVRYAAAAPFDYADLERVIAPLLLEPAPVAAAPSHRAFTRN
ncbi:MAG: TlpA disulfide reductase family protein [Burkholderiales bacterium]